MNIPTRTPPKGSTRNFTFSTSVAHTINLDKQDSSSSRVHVMYSYASEALIDARYLRTSSLPFLFLELVAIATGGSSLSAYTESAYSTNAVIFSTGLGSFFFFLSVFVNTMLMGTSASFSQTSTSLSAEVGGIDASTSSITCTSCSRFKKYSFVNPKNSIRWTFDTLAYPYPGRSTKYHFLLIRKWLMVCVFPGVLEIFANFPLLVSILIKDDLPTLERPMTANSGLVSLGHWLYFTLLVMNSACLIFHSMFFSEASICSISSSSK
mmetsp:Transcript_32324/g.39133  ORF Transcript_32324/g.39133 Transcript_32324/m.39133 type:complete len:266 (+) Transcript_32324:78-875(+)